MNGGKTIRAFQCVPQCNQNAATTLVVAPCFVCN